MARTVVAIVGSLVFALSSAAAPGVWNVDPARSSLTFEVQVSGQKVVGRFKTFAAQIAFDPADLAQSSAVVTIDMSEANSGDVTRDAMLLKPDWFNVLDFPQSRYQTTAFVARGGNVYEAQGKLTLKGVTKNVALPFTLVVNGDTAVAKGEATLQRLMFNVGQGSEFQSATPVALSVKVMVNVTAQRAK